jgi:hypothetical protein
MNTSLISLALLAQGPLADEEKSVALLSIIKELLALDTMAQEKVRTIVLTLDAFFREALAEELYMQKTTLLDIYKTM